jgi:enterochelin esterase-like enzyme
MHSRTLSLMKTAILFAGMTTGVFANTATPVPKPAAGTIQRLDMLPSASPAARTVDVWLPPGYSDKQKYAVLYMHDGQMLFDAGITWNGQEWRVDEVAAQLMADGKVRPFIVVAVHNDGKTRHSDYFPQKPFESLPQATRDQLMRSARNTSQALFGGDIASDAYLKFLVDDLKPYIDGHFSVYTDAENTAVMGSSMGGLISLYAISEYPRIFGSAAGISTHWPGVMPGNDNPVPEAFFSYMRENLPDPAGHRLYFDYGTATLDAFYPPLQAEADAVLREKGYSAGNWRTREFPGAEHSENAWSARLDIPLQFLFGVER